MNRKQVVETLEMENELICFNPLTGEEILLECVDDLNRNCYDAHQEAIRLINNSIPIEWIKKQIEEWKNWGPEGLSDDEWEYGTCLETLLEKWEKEND